MTAALIEGAGLGWSNGWIVPAFEIATLPGLALVAIERRARPPRLPLLLFSNAIFSLICYIFMSGAATFFGMVFDLSLYLQKLGWIHAVADWNCAATAVSFPCWPATLRRRSKCSGFMR
jgi:hypothetical protein